MLQDRCIYCLYDQVVYEAGQKTVRCPACGNLLYIAEFKSEKLKLDEAEKARDQAIQALQTAEKEKQEADQRLFDALTALENVRTGQAQTQGQLDELLSGMTLSQENQQSVQTVLNGLTEGQLRADGKQNVITELLQETMKSGKNADQKLQLLEILCGKIVNAQGSIMDQLGMQTEICESIRRLDMDVGKREELIMEFARWNQSSHQEDIQRLSQIQHAASDLLGSQQRLSREIIELSEAQKRAVAGERSIDIYWRLILCHYGVEYLFSEAENRYVPTFYYPDTDQSPDRMTIWQDLLYQLEMDGGRPEYTERMTELKEILEAYRHIMLEETPYDVFISVKQSDDSGRFTLDGDKASELYDTLTGWNLKVFNSRRCMDRRAGHKYEPYILAALMSARVMIVVGTKGEYMESRWVKNEWQRFKWLEKNEPKINPGAQKRMLLCYLAGGMKPSEIPAGLNQAGHHRRRPDGKHPAGNPARGLSRQAPQAGSGGQPGPGAAADARPAGGQVLRQCDQELPAADRRRKIRRIDRTAHTGPVRRAAY